MVEEATGIAENDPLSLDADALASPASALKAVQAICDRFKEMVEDNRLSTLLYRPAKEPLPEKTAQRVFWAIADAYCRANNLDLSPEVNSGPGPVDFRISQGYKLKINVELKLSSNKQLAHGFETQLPTYDAAEKSDHSIYLSIRTTPHNTGIRKVLKLAAEHRRAGRRVPDVWVVDGRLKPSASKL